MLAISPDDVRVAAMEVGVTEPVSELFEQLRAEGVRAVSPNGVLGDPTNASASAGRLILKRWVAELVADLLSVRQQDCAAGSVVDMSGDMNS